MNLIIRAATVSILFSWLLLCFPEVSDAQQAPPTCTSWNRESGRYKAWWIAATSVTVRAALQGKDPFNGDVNAEQKYIAMMMVEMDSLCNKKPNAHVAIERIFGDATALMLKKGQRGAVELGQIPSQPQKETTHGAWDVVKVGSFEYQVRGARWSNTLSKLGSSYGNIPPDAMFLSVNLHVENIDRQERTIPPFKLIDQEGREYGTSNKAWMAENALGIIDSINPGVSKSGVIVFDVPRNNSYKLRVSGGYWSGTRALVTVEPEPFVYMWSPFQVK